MNTKRWAALAVLALLVAGCDDAKKPGKVTTTTTRPADVAPATKPAVVERAAKSMLVLDDGARTVEFPRARLRLHQKEPKVVVMLFSDDPKPAFNENSQGNSYYFEMELNSNDSQDLEGLVWQYRAASMEHVDSLNGIFLDGASRQLQPQNANIQFNRLEDRWQLTLNGQFLEFNTRETSAAPMMVRVRGTLIVDLETK